MRIVAQEAAPSGNGRVAVEPIGKFADPAADAAVRVRVSEFALGPGKGSVALLVDRDPPLHTLNLGPQVSLGRLAPGAHLVRAVLLDAEGQALRSRSAYAECIVRVGERLSNVARRGPLLAVVAPRADVSYPVGQEVPLDFHVKEAVLSPTGHTLRVTVDGQQFALNRWLPHRLLGLGRGAHAVELELLGPDGEPLNGPFTGAQRTFTVR